MSFPQYSHPKITHHSQNPLKTPKVTTPVVKNDNQSKQFTKNLLFFSISPLFPKAKKQKKAIEKARKTIKKEKNRKNQLKNLLHQS